MSIRVLIVDDHAIVRDGLCALLSREPDIEVVGTATSGREAVREAKRLNPHVVVMDIAMPELNGIEASAQIMEFAESTQIVILSMYATSEHVFRALQAGVRGYVVKVSASEEVARAVRVVHGGGRYLSESISESVVEGYIRQHRVESPLDRLSARERNILQLVVEGASSAQIAKVLFLSPKTVETYRSRLMRKLGVKNFSALIHFAIQHGVTPPT